MHVWPPLVQLEEHNLDHLLPTPGPRPHINAPQGWANLCQNHTPPQIYQDRSDQECWLPHSKVPVWENERLSFVALNYSLSYFKISFK